MLRFRGRRRHNNQEVQHYGRKDVIFCEPTEKDQLIRESRHQSDTKDRKKVWKTHSLSLTASLTHLFEDRLRNRKSFWQQRLSSPHFCLEEAMQLCHLCHVVTKMA